MSELMSEFPALISPPSPHAPPSHLLPMPSSLASHPSLTPFSITSPPSTPRLSSLVSHPSFLIPQHCSLTSPSSSLTLTLSSLSSLIPHFSFLASPPSHLISHPSSIIPQLSSLTPYLSFLTPPPIPTLYRFEIIVSSLDLNKQVLHGENGLICTIRVGSIYFSCRIQKQEPISQLCLPPPHFYPPITNNCTQ